MRPKDLSDNIVEVTLAKSSSGNYGESWGFKGLTGTSRGNKEYIVNVFAEIHLHIHVS
jgi:hypothetical protein